MKLHSAYAPEADRKGSALHFGDEPSRTRQEFVDECDVNLIMARYEKGGILPYHGEEPQYLDLADAPKDLMSAMDTIINAEIAFMTLPAIVRKEFDNDPMRFVEFAHKPENLDKMREWRLAPPAPPKEPPALGSAENPIYTAPPKKPKPTSDET